MNDECDWVLPVRAPEASPKNHDLLSRSKAMILELLRLVDLLAGPGGCADPPIWDGSSPLLHDLDAAVKEESPEPPLPWLVIDLERLQQEMAMQEIAAFGQYQE